MRRCPEVHFKHGAYALWHSSCPDRLPVSGDGLQAHREQVHTWRKLPARDQALLVLAHLRNGDTYAWLATGVGVATVYRHVREAVALLASAGRSLTAALWALA